MSRKMIACSSQRVIEVMKSQNIGDPESYFCVKICFKEFRFDCKEIVFTVEGGEDGIERMRGVLGGEFI